MLGYKKILLLSQILIVFCLSQTAIAIESNIVIIALPKSGSTFVYESLRSGLNYTSLNYKCTLSSSKHDCEKNLESFFAQANRISKTHHSPNKLRIGKYRNYSNRLVLHLRDPRQSLVSFVHHLQKVKGTSNNFKLPENFYQLSFEKQIDWAIESSLPVRVKWMQNWLALKEVEDSKADGIKILVTTYDELLKDEQALLSKIIKFYEIPPEKFNYLELPKNDLVLFRKGDPNEWRKVLTEKQKQRVAEIVPKELLQKFNWEL